MNANETTQHFLQQAFDVLDIDEEMRGILITPSRELRVELTAIHGLGPAQAQRLRALAGSRLTNGGELVLTSERTRDQARNRIDARSKLHELLTRAQQLPRPRKATRPSAGVVRRRLNNKRLQGAKKRMRKTPRRED